MNTIRTYFYMTTCGKCGYDNRFTIELNGHEFITLISTYLKESRKYKCDYCDEETFQKVTNYGL